MSNIQPPDYSVAIANPFQSAMQGYAMGAAVRDDQAALVAKQQAADAAKAQQQQQQQVIQSLLSNPNPTADDYARATLLVPGMKDQLKNGWDMLNPAQQASHLSDTGQWYAAIRAGQPEIAANAMVARADSMDKAAGAPTQQSKALRLQAQVIGIHPELAATTMGMSLATLPGGDKVITNLGVLGNEQRATDSAPADLLKKRADASKAATEAGVAASTAPAMIEKPTIDNANVRSQITDRSRRLALDQDKLTSDVQVKLKEMGLQYGQLPAKVGDDVSEAVTNALSSEQSATRMTDLAKRIEEASLSSGATAKGFELLKKVTGNQNEATRLRAEYNRIVTPSAMAAYKKVASGSTSDKDIDTAMIGVPTDTADPATMASFLRGAAKLQVYDSVMSQAKSEWLGSNRNLGKLGTDAEIDGVKVPAGTTFRAFVEQYVAAKVADKIGAQTVAGRGYMKWANPQAAPGAAGAP